MENSRSHVREPGSFLRSGNVAWSVGVSSTARWPRIATELTEHLLVLDVDDAKRARVGCFGDTDIDVSGFF